MSEQDLLDLKTMYFAYIEVIEKYEVMKYFIKNTCQRLISEKKCTAAFLAEYLGISRQMLYQKFKNDFLEKDVILLIELFGNFDQLHDEYLTQRFISRIEKKE